MTNLYMTQLPLINVNFRSISSERHDKFQNFNKIFRKNVIYVILKILKKQRFTFSSDSIFFEIHSQGYVLRVKASIFFNETSILAFVQLAIFHFRTSLGQIVGKNTR